MKRTGVSRLQAERIVLQYAINNKITVHGECDRLEKSENGLVTDVALVKARLSVYIGTEWIIFGYSVQIIQESGVVKLALSESSN